VGSDRGHRELFAAAVPIAGDLNPESARALVDFPIWAFHGSRPGGAERGDPALAALMKQLGGVFRYTELTVSVTTRGWGVREPGADAWLLAQRR